MPSNVPFGMSDHSNVSNQLQYQNHPKFQQQLPRVKLTGSGKMPVMDMRSQNIIHQNYQNIPNYAHLQGSDLGSNQKSNEAPIEVEKNHHTSLNSGMHPAVVGLPPKSPVYAVVNKANKRKIEKTNTSSSFSQVDSESCKGEMER